MIVLREAADGICGKRLRVIFSVFTSRLREAVTWSPIRKSVIALHAPVSLPAIGCFPRSPAGEGRRENAEEGKGKILVRTSSDWAEPKPGELETDMALHCGSDISGLYLLSVAATDVCSGWTEAVPLLAREQSLVVKGLDVIRANFPIPAIGFNSEGDSAFINDILLAYREEKGLVFTRSRPYQKNDQAWIEQKNGAVVRRIVGYERLSGMVAGRLLGQLCQAVRLYVNYLQPSFKLKGKLKEGSKVKREDYPPPTPADRLQRSDLVSDEVKRALREERFRLDPLALLHRIREIQAGLAAIASPESMKDRANRTSVHSLHSCRSFGNPERCAQPIGSPRVKPGTIERGRILSKRCSLIYLSG